MSEKRGDRLWPRRTGYYWIQLGNDNRAQPCFYDAKERMVMLVGQETVPCESIGYAVICHERMVQPTIVPARKKEAKRDG